MVEYFGFYAPLAKYVPTMRLYYHYIMHIVVVLSDNSNTMIRDYDK